MRWDRFFADLEDQLASEWEAEKAVLDTEAERLRLSRVTLGERMRELAGREAAASALSVELVDGTVLSATVSGAGADWVALDLEHRGHGVAVVPFAAIAGVGTGADPSSSAGGPAPSDALAQRMTFGFVLRDLARRRVGVALGLADGRVLTGTIDRAGTDHLDLAVHDLGAPRRAAAVRSRRLVPFSAVVCVRFSGPHVL